MPVAESVTDALWLYRCETLKKHIWNVRSIHEALEMRAWSVLWRHGVLEMRERSVGGTTGKACMGCGALVTGSVEEA